MRRCRVRPDCGQQHPYCKMKSTKEMARELGLLRKKTHSSKDPKKTRNSNQIFSHLVVMDFESTCWKDSKYRTQEIIEFPAVLLNTKTGKIEAEFHHYVMPQENHILSDFCKELTGITQEQVDNGIPLNLCLSKFSNWLGQLSKERGLAFNAGKDGEQLCTFVTWSDWDLGVCLLNETKRKQIRKPQALNSWIDLRATYRKFYSRKPNGLNGALQDVGIDFEGRQHSGIDDTRNTASLVMRMISDGCVLAVTKSLERPVRALPSHSNTNNNVCINFGTHPTKVGSSKVTSNQSPQSSLQDNFQDNVNQQPEASRRPPTAGLREITNENRSGKQLGGPGLGKHCQSNAIVNMCKESKRPLHDRVRAAFQPAVKRNMSETPSFATPRTVMTIASNSHQKHTDKAMNVKPVSRVPITVPTLSDVTPGIKNNAKKRTQYEAFKTPINVETTKCKLPCLKRTPPMCGCGHRSTRRMVQTPGPNVGRLFFTCPQKKSKLGRNCGCGFFEWESNGKSPMTSSMTKCNSGRVGTRTVAQSYLTSPFPQPKFSTPFSSCSKKTLGIRTVPLPKYS